MSAYPISETAHLDAPIREGYGREIARLPLTMRPALNQQVNGWEDLFPYEQRRAAAFLRGISLFPAGELEAVTQPLRVLEQKMGVGHWNFSIGFDTMMNASLLARSPYYPEWRREVQKIFSAIQRRAGDPSRGETPAGRLILLVLPQTLPIASIAGRKPWDSRGVEFRVDGDVRRIGEMAVHGISGLPALVATKAQADAGGADCWLIDAEANPGALMSAGISPPASLLQYGVLKQFRNQFLAQVNTVPKDIEGTDQILARMRQQDWGAWWPASLAGQNRLRNFVIELFLSGNGALIFSNAFVQWAASEAIRRARPRLVVARFGLRSKPKPFTGIAIFENQQKISAMHDVDDPEGSAVDALILARYVWLSALRYPEQEHTCCVCVGESSQSFYVIAPESKRPRWPINRAVRPEEVCEWMRDTLV